MLCLQKEQKCMRVQEIDVDKKCEINKKCSILNNKGCEPDCFIWGMSYSFMRTGRFTAFVPL